MKTLFLISEMNESGIIISANNDFCKISGFNADELIGKPHNILKHHDVPKAVLKDLEQSIKRGDLWKGIIKNKTKDSLKYYWTFSIIVPTKSNSKNNLLCLGVKPSESEIKNTITLFERLNQGFQIAT